MEDRQKTAEPHYSLTASSLRRALSLRVGLTFKHQSQAPKEDRLNEGFEPAIRFQGLIILVDGADRYLSTSRVTAS